MVLHTQPVSTPSATFQTDMMASTNDDNDQNPQDIHTLRHSPGVVLCPACKFVSCTRIEHVLPSNPRCWPFNICYERAPCHTETGMDSIHRCGKCNRPIAIARRRGGTEAVLPVAVRRTISRDELSRPRSARMPPSRAQTPVTPLNSLGNFITRPTTGQRLCQNRIQSRTGQDTGGGRVASSSPTTMSDFRTMFPPSGPPRPPIPTRISSRMTLTDDVSKPQSQSQSQSQLQLQLQPPRITVNAGATIITGPLDAASSVVELPNLSPTRSLDDSTYYWNRSSSSTKLSEPPPLDPTTRSDRNETNNKKSTTGGGSSDDDHTDLSEIDVFHSIPPSPADFPPGTSS